MNQFNKYGRHTMGVNCNLAMSHVTCRKHTCEHGELNQLDAVILNLVTKFNVQEPILSSLL